MEKQILKVNGMSCGHCVKSIENAMGEIGVQASIDLGAKTVTVEFDPQKISAEQIVTEIEDQGYEVVK